MMPELDGYGVINLLREHDRTQGVPFVFITARTEKEDVRRGMNLGADDYITKPFFKDELLGVIETRLKKATQRNTASAPLDRSPHLNDPIRGKELLEAHFTKNGISKEYEQGQQIIREGDYPHFLYRLEEGHIHLVRPHEYGRDYIIAELGPGELFGLPTLLEKITFHYNAKAATKKVVCRQLPKDALFKLMNTDRNVTEALMRMLAGRVVEGSDKLVRQSYDSVRRRTALTLCDLHEKYADEPISLTREELAQMVGTTKESVIRAISDFKKEGLVATNGRALELKDPERLKALLV
jgi:CRP-like cAMP-binding protein